MKHYFFLLLACFAVLVSSASADGKKKAKSKGQPPTAPVASSAGIKLNTGWDHGHSRGHDTVNDLHRLFRRHGEPRVDLAAHPEIEIYEGVTYLMPLGDAVKKLGFATSLTSRMPVGTPGFPKSSFHTLRFNGAFGGFNCLYLVVDRADQVVGVQLVDEAPDKSPCNDGDDWHTYNFVNNRTKGKDGLCIHHDVEKAHAQLLRVNSRLVKGKENALERCRWFVPRPVVDLILHCVTTAK